MKKFLLKLDSLKLQYSRTINTIYPADQKAMERFLYELAIEMEETFGCSWHLNGDELEIHTKAPVGIEEGKVGITKTAMNLTLDSAAIKLTKSNSDPLIVEYNLKFGFRIIFWSLLLIAVAVFTSDKARWAFIAAFPLVYSGAFILANSGVKNTIENTLKNRYR